MLADISCTTADLLFFFPLLVHLANETFMVPTDLPDPHGVEAAVVNEGAVLDEVREDGAHGALVAGGLLHAVARFNYLECGLPVALPRALITVGQVRLGMNEICSASRIGLSFRVELPDLVTSANFGLSRVGGLGPAAPLFTRNLAPKFTQKPVITRIKSRK